MTVGAIKILPLVVVAVERLTLSARLITKGAAPKTKARLSPDRESFESFIPYLYAIGRWPELKKTNTPILSSETLHKMGHVELDFSAIPKLYGPGNFWHWHMLLRAYLEANDLWRDDHPKEVCQKYIIIYTLFTLFILSSNPKQSSYCWQLCRRTRFSRVMPRCRPSKSIKIWKNFFGPTEMKKLSWVNLPHLSKILRIGIKINALSDFLQQMKFAFNIMGSNNLTS